MIDFDKHTLERRIRDFINPNIDDEILKKSYDLSENQSRKIKEQREKLRKDFDWKDTITKILYRPFDERWILYHDEMVERTRKDVMRNMLQENIGLITVRQAAEGIFNHIIVTSNIIESRITLSNKGIAYLFPLYLYHQKKEKKKNPIIQLMIFESEESYDIILPNTNKELIKELSSIYKAIFLYPLDSPKKHGREFGSKKIFYYVYAILYSNIYRSKYAEFLRMDFPRLPFTKNFNPFIKLAELGEKLSDIHLLKFEELNNTIAAFPIEGSNKVEKVKYENEMEPPDSIGKVWINNKQFFDGVKKEVWQYQIGGYQVCEKWLKERKGRKLTLDEINTYFKIVTALSKTIELQNEIDKYYEDVEKTL